MLFYRPHLEHSQVLFAIGFEIGIDGFAAAPFAERADRNPRLV
ncbi:MAG: hypothetical protein U9R47_04900 [Actinomycetota bacterium]|nr:hypothetical protein [Actinomycetota bacterium]